LIFLPVKFNANAKYKCCELNVIEHMLMPLWTSASSEGKYCAVDRTFAWCTTSTIIEEMSVNDTQLWDGIPQGSDASGNCVTLKLNKNESSAQFSLAACTDSKPYMCQV
jgi:hypothetical protein